jgi:KaiC/GvpD/RAD55 family RecA-like ATPase
MAQRFRRREVRGARHGRLSEQAARRRPACLRPLTGTVVSRRGLDAKAPPEATREFPNAR